MVRGVVLMGVRLVQMLAVEETLGVESLLTASEDLRLELLSCFQVIKFHLVIRGLVFGEWTRPAICGVSAVE